MMAIVARRLLLVFLMMTAVAGVGRAAELTFVTLGTGTLTGNYYPVGRAICRLVDRGLAEHGTRCSAEATAGSVYNVLALRDRELDFALVQSDVQFDAYSGSELWQEGAFPELRSVLSLYPELVTVATLADSPIKAFSDLRTGRVNIGNPGSGTRATWERFASVLGWRRDDLAQVGELRPDAAAEAVCEGRLDAEVELTGHPSPGLAARLARCDLRLLAIDGPEVDAVLKGAPHLIRGTIPGQPYGHLADVPTFGLRATLVTRADVPDRVVRTIAEAVIKHVDRLRAAHPSLETLQAAPMVSEALAAPLHPGAERLYRDLGLLK